MKPAHVLSGDHPFNNAANWGGTGLMEIPNARILEDGTARAGYAEARPFQWYGGGMGVFPGLEAGFVLTELANIDAPLGHDYGNYKDKALFLKYQILPESRLIPAIAAGIHDFHGTRLFQSEYLVLSRQVYPFDLTLGYGTKRLKGDVTLPPSNNIGIFAGIECALHERLLFMVEFNPIEYEKDKKAAVPEGADSPFNYGLRFKALPGVDLGMSYQRGEKLGFMAHVDLKVGEEVMPKKPDPWFWGQYSDPMELPRDPRERVQSIKEEIEKAGMNDVVIHDGGATLTAEFENSKYLYNQKAVGRVFRILFFYSTPETQTLEAVLTTRKIPMLKVSVSREDFDRYVFGKIKENEFLKRVKINLSPKEVTDQDNVISTERDRKPDYAYGIKPDFEPYLNDPSGFFKAKIGIKPYGSATLWQGGAAFARFDIPIYSNISSSNKILPGAVRSDSWVYSEDKNYYFEKLLFDQAMKLNKRTFARFSLGYFESMYAGTNGEILTFIGDGDLAVGVEGDWVTKREPGTLFDLKNFRRNTILGNIYYSLRDFDVTLQAQYGKFLAGDIGWRFDVGRSYANGVEIGLWYSITDTSDFTDPYNKNYHDKGVYIAIPARILMDYEVNDKFRYGISPWTRDVAATVQHWQSLYGMGKDLMPGSFAVNIDRIME
jgi:hypothetical protein